MHRAPASRRPGSTGSSPSLKAYTTRVGEGPFPTELLDDNGEWLRKTGGEFGTTTGRPRRCGWFDAVVARYATRVNGVTDFVLTKLDVLTGLEKIPVCVAYDVDGVRHDEMPIDQTDFHHAKPIYEDLPAGRRTSPAAARFDDLPAQRPALRRCARGDHRRARSRRSASAPAATRSSAGTSCSVPEPGGGRAAGGQVLTRLGTGGPGERCAPVQEVGRRRPLDGADVVYLGEDEHGGWRGWA